MEHIADTSSHGGTVDRVVESLRAGILNSRYELGQRLVEADLTRQFGVSRGPLREAFRRLTAEGLLQIVPNRGALVRRLTFDETIELFQVRSALECLGARLAAGAIDQGDNRQRFDTGIRPIWSEAPRAPPLYHEENRLFHLAIRDICGNAQLTELSRQLQLPLLMLQLSGEMTPEMYWESVMEHREIAAAISRGDGDTAEEVMRRHLARAIRAAKSMSPSIFRKPD